MRSPPHATVLCRLGDVWQQAALLRRTRPRHHRDAAGARLRALASYPESARTPAERGTPERSRRAGTRQGGCGMRQDSYERGMPHRTRSLRTWRPRTGVRETVATIGAEFDRIELLIGNIGATCARPRCPRW